MEYPDSFSIRPDEGNPIAITTNTEPASYLVTSNFAKENIDSRQQQVQMHMLQGQTKHKPV